MCSLLENIECEVLIEVTPAGDEVRQGFPADVFHDDEAEGMTCRVGHFPVIEGSNDVDGVYPFRRSSFIAETIEELSVVRELGAQDLHGHVAVVADIGREPHGGHAAVADDPPQPVVVADQRLETLDSLVFPR